MSYDELVDKLTQQDPEGEPIFSGMKPTFAGMKLPFGTLNESDENDQARERVADVLRLVRKKIGSSYSEVMGDEVDKLSDEEYAMLLSALDTELKTRGTEFFE
jgi:hypothetical protein